ncbi:MAG: low molecular weight protein-tyrosine-phosphatase [Novosphingobium sp.]
MSAPDHAILFVCLGNICRSPLAEAAFRQEAGSAGLDVMVDSAGTGNWHAGKPPDRRACDVALRYGCDIGHYRARQVVADDFRRFTRIFALDGANLADLRRIAPAHAPARLSLLLDLVPGREGQSVADPYYGDEADFQETWREVTLAAQALTGILRDRG